MSFGKTIKSPHTAVNDQNFSNNKNCFKLLRAEAANKNLSEYAEQIAVIKNQNLLKSNMAADSCSPFPSLYLRPRLSLSFSLHTLYLAPGCAPSVWRRYRLWKKVCGHIGSTHKAQWSEKHEERLLQGHGERGTTLRNHPMSVFTRALTGRAAPSHFEPLSVSSDTQTRIATAAADISAKWIELFASLVNVRTYQF